MIYVPYGALHVDHYAEIAHPELPRLWVENGSKPEYFRWIEAMTGDIANGLWPRWDAKALAWKGKSRSRCARLTDFDLQLMPTFLKDVKRRVNRFIPATHEDFFRIEDGQTGRPGDGLEVYEPTLNPNNLHYVPAEIFVTAMEFLCASTTMLIKSAIQRPRAYQVAQQKGIQPFRRYHGNTADSPSMVSGHCLEGCLGGAWIAWRLHEWVPTLNWGVVEPALQQWTVDVGDRRVMCQIHYPSDNISSWWVALSLLAHLQQFGAPEAPWLLEFVKGAIPKSRVYKALMRTPPPCALWPRLVEVVTS